MRALLIILLIHGLAPGIGELVETLVHRATTGHFAHSADEEHDRESSAGEHGCAPTAHRCHCCANLSAVARPQFSFETSVRTANDTFPPREEAHLEGVVAPLFRPPIA